MHNILLAVFFVWSLPMGIYRSRFRKRVYQTDSWFINLKPVFVKELKALFGNMYPDDEAYMRLRNFYRFYLLVYVALLMAWKLT